MAYGKKPAGPDNRNIKGFILFASFSSQKKTKQNGQFIPVELFPW